MDRRSAYIRLGAEVLAGRDVIVWRSCRKMLRRSEVTRMGQGEEEERFQCRNFGGVSQLEYHSLIGLVLLVSVSTIEHQVLSDTTIL